MLPQPRPDRVAIQLPAPQIFSSTERGRRILLNEAALPKPGERQASIAMVIGGGDVGAARF